MSLSFGDPAMASPATSPFTSAMNTGTPMRDRPSASVIKVTVLPVPVAPATRPWRFAYAGSRWTGPLSGVVTALPTRMGSMCVLPWANADSMRIGTGHACDGFDMRRRPLARCADWYPEWRMRGCRACKHGATLRPPPAVSTIDEIPCHALACACPPAVVVVPRIRRNGAVPARPDQHRHPEPEHGGG